MARKLRVEMEGGVYHIIARGNYRAAVFAKENTKEAFLKCLDEACVKTGWRVHAWCVMSNHYHLAVETPQANLAAGMRWLQGTFSARFNRLRNERGHLFQGRYKSLVVDPQDGLGALCHYIHLNPIRAKLCPIGRLPDWRWSGASWVAEPKRRLPWFVATSCLAHSGDLADTPAGRRKYFEYLDWLQEDASAQRALKFESMASGWAIGPVGFKKAVLGEHREAAAALKRGDPETTNLAEMVRQDALAEALRLAGRKREDLFQAGKSEPWKLDIAAKLKATTTATNRWLGENLNLGALHEVSRKLNRWERQRGGD
jgi:putative transposase